jgi:hypothetical protein
VTTLVPLLVSMARLLLEIFLPIQKETADVTKDPRAPDAARLANPDRLRAFRD